MGYIGVVALCYAVWGVGNSTALIYTQLALVWLLYPLMFHILLHVTGRHALSLGAMAVWLSFLDGYQWDTWALPDSLYRLIFVAFFFLLLRLWETERRTAFAITTLGAVALGTSFRIETPLYALPAIWIAVNTVRQRHAWVALAGLAGVALLLWRETSLVAPMAQMFLDWQLRGLIFDGLGYHIKDVTFLAPPADPSTWGLAVYLAHVLLARLWYSVTPFPAFWSTAHRAYYSLYVVPAYVLMITGLATAVRSRNRIFLVCAWIFLAGLLLRVLVPVDPPLRYGFTPQVFLFFCAVMGWPSFQAVLTESLAGGAAPARANA